MEQFAGRKDLIIVLRAARRGYDQYGNGDNFENSFHGSALTPFNGAHFTCELGLRQETAERNRLVGASR